MNGDPAVWFGQVGWQRVGVVYCKQNTVITLGGTAWDGALGHFTLSQQCHGHLADMCKPLERRRPREGRRMKAIKGKERQERGERKREGMRE